MVWKIALAAASAALLAPVAQMATGLGGGVEVSGGAWTGAVRQIAAPATGRIDDPAFQAALAVAASAVCQPENQSLANADRERACIADAIAHAEADFTQVHASVAAQR
jgi:hypothetical protein